MEFNDGHCDRQRMHLGTNQRRQISLCKLARLGRQMEGVIIDGSFGILAW